MKDPHEQQCDTAQFIEAMQAGMAHAQALVAEGVFSAADYRRLCAEIDAGLAEAQWDARLGGDAPADGKRGR